MKPQETGDIEIVDVKLIASKKYRGRMSRVACALFKDFSAKHHLQKERIYFINTLVAKN